MLDFIDPWLANGWVLGILLVLGFFLLVGGADWLVDGASALAKRFHVSDLVIGLTVVAFGTSMPEFVVNMIASTNGSSELAITNVLGSNAINIFVILGLTALIWPVSSQPETRRVDLPFSALAAMLILFFACYTKPDTWTLHNILHGFSFQVANDDYISRYGGGFLLLLFIIYMIHLTRQAKKNPVAEAETQAAPKALYICILLILAGLAGLTIGGELCVKTATRIATDLGVSEAIIGLTVVALGTSLPELATSCMAAAKHNSDLALGNCVGSCIFNVFFVISISALVCPLQAYDGLVMDAFMAFLGPALTWVFVVTGRNKVVSRIEGGMLLLVYGVYLTYRLMTI